MADPSKQFAEELQRQAQRRPASKKLTPLGALKPFLRPLSRHDRRRGPCSSGRGRGHTRPARVALKNVVDHGFSAAEANSIGRYFLALIAVAGVIGIASALRFYLVTWLGERVVADIRSRVFSHVLSLSPAFFETTRTGEVLSRLTADTTLIQTVVGSSASFAMRNLVMAAGGLVMMAITSPKLTALCLVGVPLVVGVIVLFGRRVRGLSRQFAGPHRGNFGAGQRDAERGADGAGLHP